jgi:hypothetical protein
MAVDGMLIDWCVILKAAWDGLRRIEFTSLRVFTLRFHTQRKLNHGDAFIVSQTEEKNLTRSFLFAARCTVTPNAGIAKLDLSSRSLSLIKLLNWSQFVSNHTV